MRRRASKLLLAAAALLTCWADYAEAEDTAIEIPERPDQLGAEAVKFSPAVPERWVLDSGLTVLFMHDAELPLVSATLYIPGGSLWEPRELRGLASATGAQMREGGIKGLAPTALDKRLSDLAASVESSFGEEFGTVSFFSLSEDFHEVFGLFSKVITEPSFDNARLQLYKSIALEGIRRRRDDPSTMAAITISQVIYGAQSPYAAQPTLESVSKLNTAELRRFHNRFVKPSHAILAVSGAISRAELETALKRDLGAWRGAAPELQPPPVNQPASPGIYVLNRDFDQASVIIAHLGPPRLTDDIHAMSIFNRVFGSAGFESILFSEIRSRLGLAYAVGGGLAPGVVAGMFTVDLGTRVEEAPNAIRAVLDLVGKTPQEPFSEQQIAAAKSAVERSFVFKFSETDKIVGRKAMLDILHYPPDFDATYLARMEAVNRDAAFSVAKRWIRPEDLSIVVVGRISAADLAREFAGRFKVYQVDFDTEPRISAQPVRVP